MIDTMNVQGLAGHRAGRSALALSRNGLRSLGHGRVAAALRTLALTAAVVVAAFAPEAVASEAARIDVNTASVEQLMALPGIGAAKAAAIVEERSKSPFVSVADLERVRGIGPALVAELEKHVVASSKSGK